MKQCGVSVPVEHLCKGCHSPVWHVLRALRACGSIWIVSHSTNLKLSLIQLLFIKALLLTICSVALVSWFHMELQIFWCRFVCSWWRGFLVLGRYLKLLYKRGLYQNSLVPLAYSTEGPLRKLLCLETEVNKPLSFPESEDITLKLE